MKEEKECKIVQDLLPNYIEGLTDKQTNEFIEEHFQTCEECKKVYEEMKESSGEVEGEKSRKKVDFLRKYRTKLRILKSCILVILAIFLLHVGRNMVIIGELQARRDQYDVEKYENYSVRRYVYGKDSSTCLQFCKKGDKALQMTNIISFDEKGSYKSMYYVNGEKGNCYTEFANGEKIAKLNTQDILMENYYDFFTQNFGEYLWMSMWSSIRSEKCNGKECYRLVNVPENCMPWIDKIVYIEKETGLVVRQLQDYEGDRNETKVHDFEYEFGTVKDEMFVEPDFGEYRIVEEK